MAYKIFLLYVYRTVNLPIIITVNLHCLQYPIGKIYKIWARRKLKTIVNIFMEFFNFI